MLAITAVVWSHTASACRVRRYATYVTLTEACLESLVNIVVQADAMTYSLVKTSTVT